MRAHGAGHIVRHRHDVDEPVRQTRFQHRLCKREGGGRGCVTRTDNDGIAGDEGGRDLAHQRIDRKIERDQAGNDADRLALKQQRLIRRIAFDDLAFDAARPFRVIAHQFDAVDGFGDGVRKALAGFQRQRLANRRGMPLDRIGQFAQGIATLDRRELAPKLLRAFRCLDRRYDIRVVCGRNRGEDLAIGRIAHLDLSQAGLIDKTATDEVAILRHEPTRNIVCFTQ